MRRENTLELALTGLLTAIIILMAFTPLGYIPLVVINATIITIPVVIGSLFCGPKKGAFLGFVFGMTSFIKNTVMPSSLSAFVFSPVLAASVIGPSGILKSAFICFVPRILVGVVPYFVFKGVRKLIKSEKAYADTLPFALAGFLGSMTNTLLVMPSIYVLYREPYAEALSMSPDALLGMIGGVIGGQGLIEAIVAAVLVTALGMVLRKIKPLHRPAEKPVKMETAQAA